MKQVLQSLKNGKTFVEDVPVPLVSYGKLLIKSKFTLISAGTERMLVNFGRANYFNKARQQPEKVTQVINKAMTDGFISTFEAVSNKLDQPLPLGYCNVGIVSDVGKESGDYSVGDRVVSNGPHAEYVSVAKNLCAKVPDNVSDEEAVFTVIGSIALQGIRLAKPTLGESFAVIGLGLIGLITIQLLKSNGCRVIGIDYDNDKLRLAKKFGAEIVDLSKNQDLIAASSKFTKDIGIDGVIVTASSKSSDPINNAAKISRKRGRVILVGVTGVNISREEFYEKEIKFQVSASYGPGRYDQNYEEKGHDYPIGFVRWTEQRNFEAILEMLSSGLLDVKSLISEKFSINDAIKAYDLIASQKKSLGILIDFQSSNNASDTIFNKKEKDNVIKNNQMDSTANVGFLGSGNYAMGALIPAFKSTSAKLINVASKSGVSGSIALKKFNFIKTTTNASKLVNDSNINTVVITTRHGSHASNVIDSLKAEKHVFVEKPLCLSINELNEIEEIYSKRKNKNQKLLVGFNRRFAPKIIKIKNLLEATSKPKSFIMTVNAGELPNDHWHFDPQVGGGRIKAEVCHFIDLLRFLVGFKITSWSRSTLVSDCNDSVSISLDFEDGSIGTIHYFSNGSKTYQKERLEIFSEGKILQLNNFRSLIGFGWPGFKKMKSWKIDKGQKECVRQFVNSIENNLSCPIPAEEIFEVTRITIHIAEALKTKF